MTRQKELETLRLRALSASMALVTVCSAAFLVCKPSHDPQALRVAVRGIPLADCGRTRPCAMRQQPLQGPVLIDLPRQPPDTAKRTGGQWWLTRLAYEQRL
jgi:hypothetical protein